MLGSLDLEVVGSQLDRGPVTGSSQGVTDRAMEVELAQKALAAAEARWEERWQSLPEHQEQRLAEEREQLAADRR